MHLNSLGEVVAVRRLYIAGEEPRTTEIVVMLGKPQQFEDSTDYYCPFQVSVTGNERIAYAGGIDAFQALQEAFRMIGMELYERVNPRVENRLRWEGDEEGDLGFPRFRK